MSTFVTRSGIEELRARIRRLGSAAARRRLALPFGIQAIDRHLPGGGLALGALHEVAGGGHGAIDGAAAALFAESLRGCVAGCSGVSPGRICSPRPSRKPDSFPTARSMSSNLDEEGGSPQASRKNQSQ